jgi:NarL family two-component system response regulator LiaR
MTPPLEVRDARMTVLVVDEYQIVRRGLRAFLETADDLQLVGEAATAAQAVRLARELQPRVVLMDLALRDLPGAAAIQAVKHAAPRAQVIVLTSQLHDDLVLEALRAGAVSYLLKDVQALGLADAIRAAATGRPTLSADAAQVLVRLTTAARSGARTGLELRTGRGQNGGLALSTREIDVLRLMVRGLTNAQIARELVVSRSTANCHVSSILAKLHVTSRTRAVAVALQDRLVA